MLPRLRSHPSSLFRGAKKTLPSLQYPTPKSSKPFETPPANPNLSHNGNIRIFITKNFKNHNHSTNSSIQDISNSISKLTACHGFQTHVELPRGSLNADKATRPGQHRSPITDSLWKIASERNWDGPPQTELITKTASDSLTEVRYAFSTDSVLRERYRNPWGVVKIGQILEDLDSIAGAVATKHCDDNDKTTRPLLLVTASIDKITLRRPLLLDADVAVRGAATWVGRSSMEIAIDVIQPDAQDPSCDPVAVHAKFTFVGRDAKSNAAAPLNRLRPETDREKKLFADGAARDAQRKAERSKRTGGEARGSDPFQPGSDLRLMELLEEGRLMCEMPALTRGDALLVRDTRLENAIICQPQQRNSYGRIFGGFLMRRAFELAFSTCYVFCGARPLFLEVDYVDFHRPVDIGDLLRFKSCVLYTEANLERPKIHVEVTAIVMQPEVRKSKVSNTFYFTFTFDPLPCGHRGGVVKRVIPTTEEEARSMLARYDADHLDHAL